MEIIRGKGVFDAIAIGTISFYNKKDMPVVKVIIQDIQLEKERFVVARSAAVDQLKTLYDTALVKVGESNAQIFETHRMLLEDKGFQDAVIHMIDSKQVNAEYAVARVTDEYVAKFTSMEDAYMRQRAWDIKDVYNRILHNLEERQERTIVSDEKYIICADDLLPSETLTLDKEKVLAFVTKKDSVNSHTAILARTMNVPAIVAVGDNLRETMNGKLAIVDGFTGELYIEPDEITLSCYIQKQEEELKKKEFLLRLRGKENRTLDGKKISICANISRPCDTEAVLYNDADGIGLFRSEFLYLEGNEYPDEEMQFLAYKEVLQDMKDKRVVIRTMDIGADKQIDYFGLEKEENPALGYRAIRICLTRPEIFRTQLRALMRASVYGNLAIMFPMITSLKEIREIKRILAGVKEEMDEEGIFYSDKIELGIMIETPAAALISDLLAKEVDFFSVGTNDLIQYTLAVDRQNPKLELFGDTHHEAVLRLVSYATQSAHKYGKWIGICGELGADKELLEKWIEIGVDELSVAPASILPLRDMIRQMDLSGRNV